MSRARAEELAEAAGEPVDGVEGAGAAGLASPVYVFAKSRALCRCRSCLVPLTSCAVVVCVCVCVCVCVFALCKGSGLKLQP